MRRTLLVRGLLMLCLLAGGALFLPPNHLTGARSVAAQPAGPDLQVTVEQWDTGSTIVPGVNFILRIFTTSTGPADNVEIRIVLPSYLTPTGPTAGDTCSPDGLGNTICLRNFPFITNGVQANSSITLAVNDPVPAGIHALSVTFTVSDDGTRGADPNTANNTVIFTAPIDAAPDLTLTKSDGGATAVPGATLAYTLTYTNSGNQGATGVTFTETVPANTTFNPGASTAGWSCVPNNSAGSVCTLTVGALAGGGGSGSATFAVTVANPVAAGVTQISSAATIADNGANGADSDPSNNSATDPTPLNAAPNLSITKSDGGATVLPGGAVAYTLTYTNSGNQGATGVTLTETVPANTTFNPGASTAGWSCVPNNSAGSVCTLTVGALAGGGGSGSATFAVTVANPVPVGVNQLSNTAGIADDGANGADADPSNNSATDTTPIMIPPVIAKSFVPATIGVMGTSALTISVTNPAHNLAPLTGVAFSDTFAGDLRRASGATVDFTGCDLGVSIISTLTSLEVSNLTIPVNMTCTFTLNVTAASAGPKPNTTSAVSSSNGGTGNTASATLSVDGAPPTVMVSFPPPHASGWFTSAGVQGTVTATDPANVAAITCTPAAVQAGTLTGAGTNTATAPLTITAEGNHAITCTATDGAGNQGAASGSQNTATVRIDRTPPATTATTNPAAPNAAGWFNTAVTVTLTSTDQPGLSGIASREYRLNGASWTPYTSPITITTEGEHTVEYRATDLAGNVEPVKTLTVKLDRTPPELRLRFAPEIRGVVVEAFEPDTAGSGLASSHPLSPVICTTQRTGEQCLYRATDQAGNATTLTFLLTKTSTSTTVRVVSVQYSGRAPATPLTHSATFTFAPATGTLSSLTQTLTVVEGSSNRKVESRFPASGMPGGTQVTTTVGGGSTTETCSGQTLLWLRTSRTNTGVALTVDPPCLR